MSRMGSVAGLAVALGVLTACAGMPAPRAVVEEGSVVTHDGVRVVYDVRGAGDTAVVLLHGWRCDRAQWRWTAADLAQDHRVVSIDLAGHGDSGTAARTWTVETLAADVQTVVEALDLRRVVLVGHSMGGPVSLDAARRMPGRVVGVVGVDTLHDAEFRFPKEAFAQAVAALAADPEKALRQFLPTMVAPGSDPAIVEWLLERALRADDAAAAGLMGSFADVDLAGLLSRAGVPVRCINSAPGTMPTTIPTVVATNRRYADFDAVLLEGVGHYPMVERPVTFTARLREVLAGLR